MRILLLVIVFVISISASGQVDDEKLRIGYTAAAPFIVENGEDVEGLNVWLWKRVASDLNIEYEMIPMEFSSMLDSLRTGGIDLSINPLTITSQRSKEMEFTHSFYASNATIAIAQVSSFDRLKSYLSGFLNVGFLSGLLILLFIIFLFGVLGWLFERKKNPEAFRPGRSGLWDGMWWSAVTLTTVGYGDKAPVTKFGKITALVLMFGGLLFISGLTASIASSLTVNQLTNNPDGFNEFKGRAVGTITNSGTENFLSEHFFKDIHTYSNVPTGLKNLDQGNIKAFIYDEPILKYAIQRDSTLHKLELLPVKFDIQFYAFGLPKTHVELEQRITQRILEIIETEEWDIVLNEYGLAEF
ncbi:transporter substrate-binding domain-containing protein [Maribacter sp. BPC-D8]|uniref:transporter substrate-binding domain-containing protein n=1 Tax=Maribacter sp. BPC-D8 TaxID=3053613 RepID=UPI002B495334|nr:transporter substrate-binding domain-containing protein [Maribacter sp. BPC-D8]WRI30499.1 transporter substrate-binding domain-containing protein [Maribacter sp. BPC-D8]